MCAVSVVFDYYRNTPITYWNQTNYGEFREIIQRLDKLDKALGERECHDPAKAEWTKRVEDRLAALEEAARRP